MPESQDQSCGIGAEAPQGHVQQDNDLGGGGQCQSEKSPDAGNERKPIPAILKKALEEIENVIRPKGLMERLRMDRAKFASRVTSLDRIIETLEKYPEAVTAMDEID